MTNGPDYPLGPEHPAVEELRERLQAEEEAYAGVLAGKIHAKLHPGEIAGRTERPPE